MKLAVFSPVLHRFKDGPKIDTFEDAVRYLKSIGVNSIELEAGAYNGDGFCNCKDYLDHPEKIENLKAFLIENDFTISALSCHGNPVSPDKADAKKCDEDFDNAVLLAEKLGIDTVVCFSGCAGDNPDAKYPNWIVCSWPEPFKEALDWQWNEVLIPYWKKKAEFCKLHGVKVALEMHPGFMVYNPPTLMKLRKAVGDTIGANVDPAHFFWQGIKPVEAIKYLGRENAIYHFHAKDTRIDEANCSIKGVLDTESTDYLEKSFSACTPGSGHDEKEWTDMIRALHLIGYSGAVSLENEDLVFDRRRGVEKGIDFLREIVSAFKEN